MSLSIIIPVGLDPGGLEATLASLSASASSGIAVQILVCNDGGHGAIRGICSRFQVQCLDIVPNGGSYHARNIGIGQAKHEALGFLDAGVEVNDDWIRRAVDSLREADYVAGPVRHPHSIRDGVELCQALTAFPIREYFEKYGFGATANLAIRKNVFEKEGLFDARLRSGGDREFGERIKGRGLFRQRYDENRSVLHPYRDFSGMFRKQLRTTMGIRQLAQLYPERYSYDVPPFKTLLKFLNPPWPPQKIFSDTSANGNRSDFSMKKRIEAYLTFYSLRLARSLGFLMVYRRPDSFEWSADGSQRK